MTSCIFVWCFGGNLLYFELIMENPEEILHSLEEFAKMKPKDIPRELEEYLKFVAKTGDPIYQWSAIKSLFREKLISVITEFYESCASMEIPPCPNVEMFNYDLMKNFILEKLDTFPAAPFTLQRICELLTSPRKEYTRIDKYMRALEKNILVVSTMEPGGRRTENGESIMNGIESDHDHVPEPGNEINVEEMDDSPYIQTTNHLSDRISFDNTKSGAHIEIENSVDTFPSEKISAEASTSSQEIVCVQYVSIEPIADNASNLMEETKENDVSVTITAVNIKDDEDQAKPQNVEHSATEAIIRENILESTDALAENADNPGIVSEPPEIQMETEPVESSADIIKVDNIENPTEVAPETTSSTTDKLPEEQDQAKITFESEVVPGSGDSENVSPESSVMSSDISPFESNTDSSASDEIPSSSLSTQDPEDLFKQSTDNEADQTADKETNYVEQEHEKVQAVDSTTNASGDNVECDVSKQNERQAQDEAPTKEIPLEMKCSSENNDEEVQSSESDKPDSPSINEANAKIEQETSEVSQESSAKDKIPEISEEKDEEPSESKTEEASSPQEKDTLMEVDVDPQNALDANTKEEVQSSIQDPESSGPTENP